MAVRAKFKCGAVTKRTGWGESKFVYEASFSVVTQTSEENSKFFTATPGGSLSLTTLREDFFEVGKEYYLDITEAE